MAEVAVKSPPKAPEPAAKSATVAPVKEAPKPVGQPLRAVQTPRLTSDRVKPAGYFTEDQQVMMRPDWDFDDVLNPDFWAVVAPTMQANAAIGTTRDRLGTVVEIITPDNAFYARVYVKGLRKNAQNQADGLYVECIGPQFDPETGKLCPVDLNTGLPWKGRQR